MAVGSLLGVRTIGCLYFIRSRYRVSSGSSSGSGRCDSVGCEFLEGVVLPAPLVNVLIVLVPIEQIGTWGTQSTSFWFRCRFVPV